jgi:diadenosine tetraphosphatase ApaH/serine/threonine PP2A family protein phosphatase
VKTALVCCIHGNLAALQAVARDIETQKADRVYCLGDIVGYGAYPRECLQFVRDHGWPTVLGNHEAAVLDPTLADSFTPIAKACIYYSLGAVTKSDREWMRALPHSMEIDEFQLVHGSTVRPNQWQRYVLTVEAAQEAFAAATRNWVFHGHTHVSLAYFNTDPISYSSEPLWKLDDKTRAMLNVGSVGQPRDKDPRACYAVFDSAIKQVTIHRVAYDVERTCAEYKAAGLPAKIAERLITGV